MENKQTTETAGRTVELKSVDITVDGQPWNYGHLMLSCLNVMPKGGWTTTVMKERISTELKIDVEKEEVKLSHADIAVLKECVKNFAWGMKHKDLIEFEDYIMSL